jgi:hypothetical protein
LLEAVEMEKEGTMDKKWTKEVWFLLGSLLFFYVIFTVVFEWTLPRFFKAVIIGCPIYLLIRLIAWTTKKKKA